ncbi:T6SS immunity protein Tli4 family protein [Robbsia andropogonis]|uniref:T6SS immunity protein Tli4 family protein n=1 Tax=Robbsia andropogonis TaxID=28092 RepID=UPI000463AB13|nr:T6SS immunity protein Tli4 family protein [Robbsia andropogonis]
MNLLKHILLLSVTAFITANAVSGPISYNSQKVPFGRFSVDIPRLSSIANDAKYLGIDVVFHHEKLTPAQFKEEQDAQARKYENAPMQVSASSMKLWKAAGLNPDEDFGSKQLVQYQYDHANNEAFIAYRKAPDSSDAIARLTKLGPTGVASFEITNRSAVDINESYNDIRRAASMFKFAEKGSPLPLHAFCIKEGCFHDNDHSTANEHAGLSATLGGHKDAELSVETTSRTSDGQTFNDLEKETEGEIELLKDGGGHVTVLKREKRTLVGQSGYEIAVKVEAPEHQPIYIFTWVGAGETGDPLKPVIQFDLRIDPNTHQGISTISSTDDAVQLWEALVTSFQVR